MQKGEIWRVRLPHAPGHAQTGERPAVIIQNDRFISSLPTVLIVPFTSTQAALRFSGTLLVQPDSQNGLTTPSVALVFQTRAVDKNDRLKCLGTLDSTSLDQILDLLGQRTG